jgi:Inner membrane component of T3SS, cytoplasmic domain
MSDCSTVRELRVLSGLHAGAHRLLAPGEYVLGSGAGCDIIIRDDGVAAQHLQIVLGEASAYAKRLSDAAWSCGGKEVRSTRRLLRDSDVISVGPVRISLRLDEAVHDEGERDGSSRTAPAAQAGAASAATGARRRPRLVRSVSLIAASSLAVSCVLLFAYQSAVSGVAERSRGEQRKIEAQNDITNAKLPNVRVALDERGSLIVSGLVKDLQEEKRLLALPALYAHGTPTLKIKVATQLVQHVAGYLDDPGLTVTHVGNGRLLVSGRSTRPETRARQRQLVQELRGVAEIEVVASMMDAPPADKQNLELPVKVVGIYDAVGAAGYFKANDGTRYYEGSILKNGAEVVSIGSDQVIFRQGGKVFSYQAAQTGLIHD